MSGALIFIQEDLEISDLQIQLLVGVSHLCGLPGSMVAGRTSDYIGRRYTITLASIAFLLGSVLMGYGPSYPILMIGNIFVGIGVSFAMVVAPVYSAEISPPSSRGFFTSLPTLSVNTGFLLGYMSNYFFEKLSLRLGWRMMVAVPALPSLCLIILMLKLVESPRWLVMQGRVGEARKVLLLVSNSKEEAEQRLMEIKGVVGIDKNCTQDTVEVPKKTRSGEGALKELFCKASPTVRRILIAAILLHLFLRLGGSATILLYSPRVFERTGITDKSKLMLATVGMGISKFVFSFISIFLSDKFGRRILLLISAGGVFLSMLGLGICLTIVEHSKEKLLWASIFTIFLTYTFVAFMSIGIGPVTWVYSSEIFPLRFRAQGLGLCVVVNRITTVAVVTSFISIYKAITMGGIFFLFTGINVLALRFYYSFLPETKGRSIEDMETIFRRNSKYGCYEWSHDIYEGGARSERHPTRRSLAAGRTSDYIGRRYTIAIASTLFMSGSIIMGYGPNYAVLIVGRCIAGVGVGFALLIAPVYSAEISSAKSRGFLTSLPELCIGIGILLGYVANYFLGKLSLTLGWRLMLGIAAAPSLALALGILTMPESPRWLVMQGQLGKAKEVLLQVSNSEQEAELRFKDIKIAAGIDENYPEKMDKLPEKNSGGGVWKELFVRPSPPVRWMLMAAVGIHFFEHATGIEAVMLYSPRIFKKAGVTTKDKLLLTTIGVGVTKILCLIIASFLLDKVGRRSLLLVSTAGMVCSLTVLGFSLTMVQISHEKLLWALALSIAATYTFVASFNIGLGPVTWVYSSEIFPLRLRAQGASIGVAVNRVMNAAVSMSFISIYKAITIGGAFFMFAAISALAWIFFYFFLPETKGKALEEMEMVFTKSYSNNVVAETDLNRNV
ncbi:putative polyol transporter 3, partial [Mucuna pruriens]